MKTLLVPVDFSPTTSVVVTAAAALARALPGKVVLLNVTEPVATIIDFAVVNFSIASIDQARVKTATIRLAELATGLEAGGVSATAVHVVGSRIQEILLQERVCAADYIVLGSHGHGTFYDLMVGNTAAGVLKHARCPVVVIPSHKPLPDPIPLKIQLPISNPASYQ